MCGCEPTPGLFEFLAQSKSFREDDPRYHFDYLTEVGTFTTRGGANHVEGVRDVTSEFLVLTVETDEQGAAEELFIRLCLVQAVRRFFSRE